MRPKRLLAIGWLALLIAPAAWAAHSDIILFVDGNKLVTVTDVDPNVPNRVFEGELNESGVPGFTDDPGYASDTLAPSSLVGFNTTGALLYWDAGDFVAPPADERLTIKLSGTPLVTVTGASGYQAGGWFAQASATGGLHRHLQYIVDRADANPISDGVYVLQLELMSSAHDTSDPFVIIFGSNADSNQVEAAVAAAPSLFDSGADCPGDLDGSLSVDLTDLGILLGHYGQNPADASDGDINDDDVVDLTDLGILLGEYGNTCD